MVASPELGRPGTASPSPTDDQEGPAVRVSAMPLALKPGSWTQSPLSESVVGGSPVSAGQPVELGLQRVGEPGGPLVTHTSLTSFLRAERVGLHRAVA